MTENRDIVNLLMQGLNIYDCHYPNPPQSSEKISRKTWLKINQ